MDTRATHGSPQFVCVTSGEESDVDEDVYDIEVEENHKFFANGMLAHNCVAGADMHIISRHQTEPDWHKWGPNDTNKELIQGRTQGLD